MDPPTRAGPRKSAASETDTYWETDINDDCSEVDRPRRLAGRSKRGRFGAFCAAGCLALVLGGCGSPPPASHSMSRESLPDELKVSPAPLLTATDSVGLKSTSWRLVSSSPTSSEIVLQADQGSGCSQPGGLKVLETTMSVTIWSYIHAESRNSATPCLAYRYEPKWSVRLAAPLGDRPINHG